MLGYWLKETMKDRGMAIISVESSPVTPLTLVLPFSFTWALLCIYLLLSEVQHQPQLRSPWVCTEQYDLVGKNKIAILYKWAKDGSCVVYFFTEDWYPLAQKLTSTNSNFYISKCFIHSLNNQTFCHLEPAYLANPSKVLAFSHHR